MCHVLRRGVLGAVVLRYCLVDDDTHGGERFVFRRVLDEPFREAVVVVAESDADAVRALSEHGRTFEFCDSLRVKVLRARLALEDLDAAVAKCIADGIEVDNLRMWIAYAESMRGMLSSPHPIGVKLIGNMTEACRSARVGLIKRFGGEA